MVQQILAALSLVSLSSDRRWLFSALSSLTIVFTNNSPARVWLAPSRRVTGCILPTTHLLQWATFSVTQALNSFGWTVQSEVFCENPRIPLTGLLFFVCKDFLFVYDLFISHLIPQRELRSPPTRVSANRPTIIGLRTRSFGCQTHLVTII